MKRLPFATVEDAARAADEVREHLAGGGIIAYPTETVYGLGCALDQAALDALAIVKGREVTQPFLLLDADPTRLEGLTWTTAASALAEEFWPGPLTLALAAESTRYHPPVLSQYNTVAVRQTPLAPLQALLHALDAPITSTSANEHGSPPAMNADEVEDAFGTADGGNILLLDGGANGGAANGDSTAARIPSTLVDCAGPVPRLIREGAIPLADLRAALTAKGFTIDV